MSCCYLFLNSSSFTQEEKNTTEKNRGMLSMIRAKGNAGYTKLKDCLKKTEQSKLAELLECIEKGEDTCSVRKKVHDEMMQADIEADKGRSKVLIFSVFPVC